MKNKPSQVCGCSRSYFLRQRLRQHVLTGHNNDIIITGMRGFDIFPLMLMLMSVHPPLAHKLLLLMLISCARVAGPSIMLLNTIEGGIFKRKSRDDMNDKRTTRLLRPVKLSNTRIRCNQTSKIHSKKRWDNISGDMDLSECNVVDRVWGWAGFGLTFFGTYCPCSLRMPHFSIIYWMLNRRTHSQY